MLTSKVVSNPGPGELQGRLFFVVTLYFIHQLEQFITQYLTSRGYLGPNRVLILRWKQKPADPVALQN